MSSILFEQIEQVGKITLNRPEAYNSFVRDMALNLQEYLDDCAEDPGIRAVYITGQGKAFCAGQDLKEVTNPGTMPGFERILNEHYNPVIRRIRQIAKPVVAAVNGVAAGAGANLALACDIVVAAESASFLQAFSKIGLIPDSGGTFFLPRLVGFQKALALSMLGDKVPAVEAEQMGMIYKYFPDDQFEQESWNIAVTLAQMPTKSLALTKQAFNRSLTQNLEEQLDLETRLQTMAGATRDYEEGVKAFLGKRKPNFEGH